MGCTGEKVADAVKELSVESVVMMRVGVAS
jgi:hypothetical protein